MPPITVAALQIDPQIGEVEANLERIERAVTDAADAGATLAVAPEAAVTGYAFASLDEARPVARQASAVAADRLADIAARTGVHLVCGTLEAEGDEVRNAALIIAADGRRWVYRKLHLPFLGVDRFVTPGEDPPFTVELGPLRLGVIICYDLRFPEAARVCALEGADVIALPTNWPVGVEFHPELFAPARAAENHCYLIAADRVGTERGTTFLGRSTIIDYDGRRLADAGADEEEILLAEIDPEAARPTHVRRRPGEHEWDTIGDRRPGLYERLLQPGVDRRRPVTDVSFSGDVE
jgi:predicted amidohydrolase